MFALSQERRKAATTSVNAILRFAPMAAVTCNGLIAKAPDEIVDSLNRSPDLSNDDVLRVVDQLQLLASALEADPGGPMKLISMTVKTHGHQPLSFDFDWDVAVDAPADQRKRGGKGSVLDIAPNRV